MVEDGEENEDEESMYPPANSLEELREMYEQMDPERRQKREVLDRIAEGDWVSGPDRNCWTGISDNSVETRHQPVSIRHVGHAV
jgi:hypothetical protein